MSAAINFLLLKEGLSKYVKNHPVLKKLKNTSASKFLYIRHVTPTFDSSSLLESCFLFRSPESTFGSKTKTTNKIIKDCPGSSGYFFTGDT